MLKPREAGGARGFTLIELMVVIAIIGILMGILLPVLGAVRRKAQKVQVHNMVHECELACANFRLEYNQNPWMKPTSFRKEAAGGADAVTIKTYQVYQELKGQGGSVNTSQDYLGKVPTKFSKLITLPDSSQAKTLKDIWEQELTFRVNPSGGDPVIWSAGANKTDETNDGDIPTGAEAWKDSDDNELSAEVVKAYFYYPTGDTGDDLTNL